MWLQHGPAHVHHQQRALQHHRHQDGPWLHLLKDMEHQGSCWETIKEYWQWTVLIKVTQFEASQHQSLLAPPGCLQYHTGVGPDTIQNFNFKDSNSYHLSSQRYSICWRRERTYCNLCLAIGYFGVSNVPSQVPFIFNYFILQLFSVGACFHNHNVEQEGRDDRLHLLLCWHTHS